MNGSRRGRITERKRKGEEVATMSNSYWRQLKVKTLPSPENSNKRKCTHASLFAIKLVVIAVKSNVL